jgi:hypothetical protein
MVLDHVKSASRRRKASDPIDPNHATTSRREWQRVKKPARAAVLRLDPLARLARANVLGDVDLLSHPESEATDQRPRLGSPEMPAEWAVVALAQYLRSQTSARGDA